MIFGPAECDLPAEVWDVLAGKAIERVIWVDTDMKVVHVQSPDENDGARVYLGEIVTERIYFQAIYPWPPIGRPKLFNCYYRELAC